MLKPDKSEFRRERSARGGKFDERRIYSVGLATSYTTLTSIRAFSNGHPASYFGACTLTYLRLLNQISNSRKSCSRCSADFISISGWSPMNCWKADC
jgi:hypothetical protein